MYVCWGGWRMNLSTGAHKGQSITLEFLEAGITCSCEPLMVGAGNSEPNSGILQEQFELFFFSFF